ncbi:MAG: hypothetical protein ACRDYZ_08225 [Acidimicrobiales bacterium]
MAGRSKSSRHRTPLGTIIRGALAGAVGTAAMDLVQYAQYRAGGGEDELVHYEFGAVKDWDSAPAPAQVGKRVVEGLFRSELSDGVANRVNNVVHWAYGTGWGAVYGVLAGSAARPRSGWGPLFGTVQWLSDYVVLPPTGLYQPITEYGAKTLSKDWASRLVYGTTVAVVWRVLVRG